MSSKIQTSTKKINHISLTWENLTIISERRIYTHYTDNWDKSYQFNKKAQNVSQLTSQNFIEELIQLLHFCFKIFFAESYFKSGTNNIPQ